MTGGRADDETVTRIRRWPVCPALTLVDGRPTVNGVSYDSFEAALAAKAAGVEWMRVDLFGRRVS